MDPSWVCWQVTLGDVKCDIHEIELPGRAMLAVWYGETVERCIDWVNRVVTEFSQKFGKVEESHEIWRSPRTSCLDLWRFLNSSNWAVPQPKKLVLVWIEILWRVVNEKVLCGTAYDLMLRIKITLESRPRSQLISYLVFRRRLLAWMNEWMMMTVSALYHELSLLTSCLRQCMQGLLQSVSAFSASQKSPSSLEFELI